MAKDLQIVGLPTELRDTIKKIAKNRGETMNQFLKPKLREIASRYPEEIKSGKKIHITKKFVIFSVPDDIADQIEKIAKSHGSTPSQFLRLELQRIVDEEPEIFKIMQPV